MVSCAKTRWKIAYFDANWLLGYYQEDIKKQNEENENYFTKNMVLHGKLEGMGMKAIF